MKNSAPFDYNKFISQSIQALEAVVANNYDEFFVVDSEIMKSIESYYPLLEDYHEKFLNMSATVMSLRMTARLYAILGVAISISFIAGLVFLSKIMGFNTIVTWTSIVLSILIGGKSATTYVKRERDISKLNASVDHIYGGYLISDGIVSKIGEYISWSTSIHSLLSSKGVAAPEKTSNDADGDDMRYILDDLLTTLMKNVDNDSDDTNNDEE